jgi:5'-nucleotidase
VPAEQLELPLAGTQSASTSAARIPRHRRIFVNRNLSMAHIDWVGFDMDYTLAIYDQEAMDRLSIEVTAARLVKRGYPSWVQTIPYDTRFAIRGLLIDKKYGHIVKMDRYKAVGKAYRGFHALAKDQLRALYHSTKHRAPTSRYHFIDTLYALSEAAVFAGVIDAYDARGLPIDHARLFTEIRESIDEAHRDGTVYAAITGALPRYIRRDPDLAPTLHKFRSAGKKLFLLTNSRRSYTDLLMTHLLGSASAEYPTWRHYFDAIIVAASKPAFFQEHRPLMERVHEERDDSQMRPAQSIERGKIYEGGNLHDLERMLGVTGDRVLYVGDHIYGDILRSRRESAWRTALILQEMEGEVSAIEACKRESDLVSELSAKREELEDQLRYLQSRFKDLTRRIAEQNGDVVERALAEAERLRTKRSVERIRGQMRALDHQVEELDQAIDACFHPYWGSLMRESDDRSGFGDQVEDYACLYTSRVSNLSAYSPLQHFRSARDRMPHEQ